MGEGVLKRNPSVRGGHGWFLGLHNRHVMSNSILGASLWAPSFGSFQIMFPLPCLSQIQQTFQRFSTRRSEGSPTTTSPSFMAKQELSNVGVRSKSTTMLCKWYRTTKRHGSKWTFTWASNPRVTCWLARPRLNPESPSTSCCLGLTPRHMLTLHENFPISTNSSRTIPTLMYSRVMVLSVMGRLLR